MIAGGISVLFGRDWCRRRLNEGEIRYRHGTHDLRRRAAPFSVVQSSELEWATAPVIQQQSMRQEEFTSLTERLEKASIILRNAGALLQSIARRYYLVYTYAVQAAQKHDVVLRRGIEVDGDRRISHQALPDLIVALYAAKNSGPVLGGGPGITRPGRLPDGLAYRYSDQLQKDRKFADYGYVGVVEPYDRTTADERLGWANHLVEDLRSLL